MNKINVCVAVRGLKDTIKFELYMEDKATRKEIEQRIKSMLERYAISYNTEYVD